MSDHPRSNLHTPDEAADFLRSNARTLERWRTTGGGPRFVKVGRRVCYRRVDLEAFVRANLRAHTHDTPNPA